jgi:hypothetical protein
MTYQGPFVFETLPYINRLQYYSQLLDATLTSTLCNGYHDQMVYLQSHAPVPLVFRSASNTTLDPNDPNYQPEQQHTNIKAAIKLYEDGKIDGVEHVFIKDGKLVPEQEIFKGGAWCWNEGIWH